MSVKTMNFLHTAYGKLTLALGVMLLSWLYLLFQFSADMRGLLPSAADMEKARQELHKDKAEFELQDAKKRTADKLKKEYDLKLESFWQEDLNGDVELRLRDLIESAARSKEIKMESFGSVRTSKINNELYFAELDITMTDELSDIAAFLAVVRDTKPALFWKRADIRPGMVRPDRMQQNGAQNDTVKKQAAKTTNAPEPQTKTAAMLRFSGTIRVICRGGKESRAQ